MKNKTSIHFRNSIFGCILFLNFSAAHAQVPSWQWAESAGGNSNSYSNSIATDLNGNSYVTGHFDGDTIHFGPLALANANAGTDDFFIAKYDPTGNVLWAKRAGGNSLDYGNSICVDVNGNCYVTGDFSSSSIVFGSTTLTNPGSGGNIFIVKYDPSGNVVWAKSNVGIGNADAKGITTDAYGNSYITGYFGGASITFGSITLNNASIYNTFTVKYDALGNVVWAKSATGNYTAYANAITSDGTGNLYITGFFQSSTITFGSFTLTSVGSNDIFIVKYDSAGTELWAIVGGGLTDDRGTGISADANGNAYITGYFDSPSILFGNTTLPNAGGIDVFIAKYDSLGNELWAKSAGGTTDDVGNSICTDAIGNTHITGNFKSNFLNFGSTTVANNTTNNRDDIFVAKYDTSGNVLWAKSTGGNNFDYSQGISVDVYGNSYVTGYYFSLSISFGATTLTTPSTAYIFVGKLDNITGTTQNNDDINLNVYPNPSSGIFTINSAKIVSRIEIRNIFNEIIYSEETNSENKTVDLSNQPKGVYSIRLYCSQEYVTKMIIVE